MYVCIYEKEREKEKDLEMGLIKSRFAQVGFD
jgi:hypothetical protein